LIKPRCAICGNEPVLKESEHFFIDFLDLKKRLKITYRIIHTSIKE